MYLSDDDTEYRVYFIFDVDSFLKKYEINKNWEVYLPDKLIYDKDRAMYSGFETNMSDINMIQAKIFSIMSQKRIQPNQLNNVFQKVYILNSQKQRSHSLRLAN